MKKDNQQKKIKAGSLLISEPFIQDDNFKRTVVLITDHLESEGSVGFVINKKSDVTIEELVEEFEDFYAEVYFGGPVSTNTLHYIHNLGDLIEGSVKVSQGVYWGGDFEKLKFLVETKLVQPENIKFFLGYSGWSDGQLKEEIDEGSWIISEMDANYLFKLKPESLWKEVLENKGENFIAIAQIPGDQILN
ncbi:MAG: YqgE/AlgH family protein [Bacteroidota bacterium]|nr:YqgE/AlgH family protein [Bacteroidota bacterium]